MQHTLTANSTSQMADGYAPVAYAPDRRDDLAFFTGLWAIVPIALGGWAMIVWAAMQLFG